MFLSRRLAMLGLKVSSCFSVSSPFSIRYSKHSSLTDRVPESSLWLIQPVGLSMTRRCLSSYTTRCLRISSLERISGVILNKDFPETGFLVCFWAECFSRGPDAVVPFSGVPSEPVPCFPPVMIAKVSSEKYIFTESPSLRISFPSAFLSFKTIFFFLSIL